MARTYRRKNAKWSMGKKDHDLVEYKSKYGGNFSKWEKLDDKAYKKAWKKFHSDKEVYTNGIPGWFVNIFFQRPDRRKASNELRKYKINQEHEVILSKYKRSAGYYWY